MATGSTLKLPIQEIIDIYTKGATCRKIAKIYTCSHKTISNILKENNIYVRQNEDYTGRAHVNWIGCGDISGAYLGSLCRSADVRKLDFVITIEYMWHLFLQQNRKCFFTGLPLVFVDRYNINCTKQTASLDRIDSNKGYIEGNVQWVHKDINHMKHRLQDTRFIELCKLVADNHKD